jgi:small conductance mechanosensitive channel
MENQITKLERIRDVMLAQGFDLILSLLVVIVGLFAIKYANKGIRHLLGTLSVKEPLRSTICNAIYVFLLITLILAALVHLGFDSRVVIRLLILVALAAISLILILRPYIPTLPFKAGQTVKVGDLLGKVESTSLINTRLRTFDGKTFFVPNRLILNDIVQNYHFTPDRRIKLDVGIRYDQDLIKAKQLIEAIMIEDPRVKGNPRPAVWVVNLADSCVKLGGRCWVGNLDYWKTRCELLEKIKLRFDAEGIVIPYPQLDVHHYYERGTPQVTSAGGEED